MSFNYSQRTRSLVDVTAAQQQPDELTYEPYFGLNEKAFSLNADSRFVYESPTYLATREGLIAGIRRREGLIVLTGQIGTGKTTLCRAVLEDLGRKTYSSLVPDPFASREDLLKMMLIDFGVLSIQELTAGPLRQASRTELGYLLAEFLDSLPRDAFAIVMIDEAQNLASPLIEETRILSDTFGARGRLQIVFIGQPELHAKLKSPEMRQVDQRVCGYHRLEPMSRDAVGGYVEHRLLAAGLSRGRVLFPQAIIETLHGRTGGVPRLINRVCDRALLLAYEAGAEQVDRATLDTALIEVGAATLSPTWDSIVFAETPAAPPPAVVSQAPPAVVAPRIAPPAAVPAVTQADHAPAFNEEEHFKREIELWVAQELAPASRPPAERRAPAAGKPRPSRPTPPPPARSAAPRGTAGHTDWPRNLRSETYMQRLARMWARWIAIGLGVFVVLNLGLVAASWASTMMLPPALPSTPAPPPLRAAGLSALAVPPHDVEIVQESISATANYLVAVGLFFDRDRADRLADVLTQAGLPAMQRPLTRRGQQMQQIVLGPFFTRADALAEMLRLRKLGGYDDAAVIDASQEP